VTKRSVLQIVTLGKIISSSLITLVLVVTSYL
jgi:hypothetical protein